MLKRSSAILRRRRILRQRASRELVDGFGKLLQLVKQCVSQSPATQNRTRDHLIAAAFYSQMLYQLSYSRLAVCG